MATAPTVPNPAPISPPVGSPQSQAPTTISRDYNREAETLKKLGTNPLQAATLDPKALYEMTYSPDELANLPEYQNVLAVQDAKQSLINTPAPSATLLRPLEDALRIKGNIGKQKLGESDIFKAAGLSGYATLNQSINQNLQDMDTKYNSFVNQVSKIGGAMADTYNTVASKYKVLMDEYKTQTESIQAVMRDLMNHEQAIDLMNRQQALDLEAKAFAASLSGGGGGGGGAIPSEDSTPAWMKDLVQRYINGEEQGTLNTVIDNKFKGTNETEYYQTMLDQLIQKSTPINKGAILEKTNINPYYKVSPNQIPDTIPSPYVQKQKRDVLYKQYLKAIEDGIIDDNVSFEEWKRDYR